MTVRVILGRIVGRSRRRNPRPEELGAVTAEFAVALPAVTAVLALCLGAASTGVAQVKLEESARAAALLGGPVFLFRGMRGPPLYPSVGSPE